MTTKDSESDRMEELRSEIPDLIERAQSVVDDLKNAECSEAFSDFCANVDSAMATLISLRQALAAFEGRS